MDWKRNEPGLDDSLVWDLRDDQRLDCCVRELPIVSVCHVVGEKPGCHICAEGAAVRGTASWI